MKKNMRKLLALLVTVAMLCTVVPFGALVSASTNLVKNGDFESGDTSNWNNDAGNGFTVVEESGDKCAYLEYNAADWGNIYQYVNVEKNTDYVFSYSYKADSRFKMIFSVMGGDWSPLLARLPSTVPVNGLPILLSSTVVTSRLSSSSCSPTTTLRMVTRFMSMTSAL